MALKYGTQITGERSDRKTVSSTHTIISSRVRDIILDDSNKELFDKFGKWNGIGTIFIESTKNPVFSDKIPLIPAYPAFPNIKHYPLINELVPIIYLTDVDSTNNTTSVSAYYLPPINVWNSITHNGIPSSNVLPESQTKNYQQVEAGSTNIITNQSTEIKLGKTFNENDVEKIHPLLPYEGDIIYEGRFGNSIRLSSTVSNPKIANPWSSVGNNGSPITIIRNGQSDDIPTDSWIPTLENINKDKSSIYLTSTQRVDVEISSNKSSFTSTDNPPKNPSSYSDEQIILKSGRLLFSTDKDSILINSGKHIHLSTLEDIHIDSGKNVTLTSEEINLGARRANESVILGNTFMKDFNLLLTSLQNLASQLTPAAAIAPNIIAPIENIVTQCNVMKTNMEKYLSKTVKTK
jgi:hypothetical protein